MSAATVGVLAVLHTWTQQLLFHPHVHCLVTGGGVSDDGANWRPARKAFLVPVKALAKLVRGKLRAALQKRRPDLVLPDAAWSKPWVVHCTAWGEGEQAVLDYLARYVFRVAITNTRIVGLDDQAVTIRHKHRKSNRWRTSRIPGQEFMRRFLQHVLPQGLQRSATSACGIPQSASKPPAFACYLLLDRPMITARDRSERGRGRSAGRPCGPRQIREFAPLQRRAFGTHSPSFLRSRPEDHDLRSLAHFKQSDHRRPRMCPPCHGNPLPNAPPRACSTARRQAPSPASCSV